MEVEFSSESGFPEIMEPGILDETITMLEDEYAYEPILSDFLYTDLYANFLADVKEGENPGCEARGGLMN